eukprot:GSMAST32.ASY1.ANO1.2231.1 assembled CDS
MRELITLQVGQCGNQIGCKFWELALQEHAEYCQNRVFDEPLSSFFRNVDSNNSDHVRGYRVQRSPLGELFDDTQLITSESGAGNNWAVGHMQCGPEYEERLLELVRHQAEMCDSLQSFLLLHSLGGGTGSGLGTFLIRLLKDHLPKVYRFSTSVFPSSKNDDVITSPYNSIFALEQLAQHAVCFIFFNEALMDVCFHQYCGSFFFSTMKILHLMNCFCY